MAIILSGEEEFKDIDEVLIVVGPKLDMKIRLEVDDDDDLIREVFMEEYIEHVPGRYGRKGNVMCITVPVEERDKKFILDSGSGHDLISARKVERMDLATYQDEAVNFHTANGVTVVSTSKVDLDFKAFGETANVHVLDDTPSVISMGKRCMDHGYSFVWPSGKDPYLVDKNANIVKLRWSSRITSPTSEWISP